MSCRPACATFNRKNSSGYVHDYDDADGYEHRHFASSHSDVKWSCFVDAAMEATIDVAADRQLAPPLAMTSWSHSHYCDMMNFDIMGR